MPGKVYPLGTVLLAKFFKMTARSSAKSELTVNSSDFEVVEHDQIISEKQMKVRKPLCISAKLRTLRTGLGDVQDVLCVHRH